MASASDTIFKFLILVKKNNNNWQVMVHDFWIFQNQLQFPPYYLIFGAFSFVCVHVVSLLECMICDPGFINSWYGLIFFLPKKGIGWQGLTCIVTIKTHVISCYKLLDIFLIV